MVDFKIYWLNMMSVPESRAAVGSADGINGRDRRPYMTMPETDMSSQLEQRQRQQIVNRTPMSRLGTVDDVIPLILFLLSEDAGFITGQTIFVDGGISS